MSAAEEGGERVEAVPKGKGKGKEKGKGKVEEAGGSNGGGGGVGSGKFVAYPAAVAEYKEVVADAGVFRAALAKLHALMGSKYMVPIIGGKDLDLHKLFKQVTSRGGIEKVKADNRWKEVTASFNFPSTATNASFVLRKYYMSLLYHFEQLYFFRVQGWYQEDTDPKAVSSLQAKIETQTLQKRKRSSHASPPELSSDNVNLDVFIDGKFEQGYFVTVTEGLKSTKAILYNCTYPADLPPLAPPVATNNNNLRDGRRRRRRRKKLSTTDPRHPKPNRSGYNFFFQDQHRRLKPLYPGQDRLISKMIGELWNNLSAEKRAVYQEKGALDKERYQTQLAAYKEEQRTGQPISIAVPIQQRCPQPEVTIKEVDSRVSEGGILLSNEDYSSSDNSADSGEKLVDDEDFNTEMSLEPSMEANDSHGKLDASRDGDCFELRKRENPKIDDKKNAPPN